MVQTWIYFLDDNNRSGQAWRLEGWNKKIKNTMSFDRWFDDVGSGKVFLDLHMQVFWANLILAG